MSTAAFGSLCFTDRGGGADGTGFGVRASSEGVTPAATRLAQDACLYEPPLTWITEGRPLADYPHSLAHAARDGWFATASGHYIGTELFGAGREGNHFTHAVCTDRPDQYGHVRPAQLWGSPIWRDAAGAGTTWPPVPSPPVPGLFDAIAVQRWVLEQATGEQTLLAVCSAVQRVRAGGPRIVFIAEEPDPVLAWIAAATLLLPRRDALTVGFKVFARDATTGPHDIVAVHVDWASGYRVGAERGLAIFDLVTATHSSVPVSAAAAFWVPRFLRRDCLDVVDAVELSGLCRADPNVDPGQAERVAGAALALAEPILAVDLDAVLEWAAATGGGNLPERRRRELLDRMLDAQPEAARLRELAGLAERLQERDVRERIRWRVFGMESAAVLPGISPGADPPDAAAASLAIADRIETAPPESVPGLLALATDYTLQPDPDRMMEGLRRFARWWVEGGLDVSGRERWVCRRLVDELVREELEARLEGAPQASQWVLGDLWWSRLWRTVRDPRTPLDATLASATMLHGTPDERVQITDRVLTTLGSVPPPDALDVAWQALYLRRGPSPDELVAVLHRLGPAITPDPDTLRLMADSLPALPSSPVVLEVLKRLGTWGHTVARGPLADLQLRARQITEMERTLGGQDSETEGESGRLAAAADIWAERLSAFPGDALRDLAPDLVDAFVRLRPGVAAYVIGGMAPEKRIPVVGHLRETLGVHTEPRQIALTFALSEVLRSRDRGNARGLAKRLGHVARSLDDVVSGQVALALNTAELERGWYDLNRPRWRRGIGAGA